VVAGNERGRYESRIMGPRIGGGYLPPGLRHLPTHIYPAGKYPA